MTVSKACVWPVLFTSIIALAPVQAQIYGDCAPLMSRQDSDTGREILSLLRRENDQLEVDAISLCYTDADRPPVDVEINGSYALIYVNQDLFQREFGLGAGQNPRPAIYHAYLLAKTVIEASMLIKSTNPLHDQRPLIVAGSNPFIGRRLAELGYSPEELNGLIDQIIAFDRSVEARTNAESIRRHFGERYLTIHPTPAIGRTPSDPAADSPSPVPPHREAQQPPSPLARLWEWIAGTLERVGTIGTGVAMLIAAAAWALRRASVRRKRSNPVNPR